MAEKEKKLQKEVAKNRKELSKKKLLDYYQEEIAGEKIKLIKKKKRH